MIEILKFIQNGNSNINFSHIIFLVKFSTQDNYTLECTTNRNIFSVIENDQTFDHSSVRSSLVIKNFVSFKQLNFDLTCSLWGIEGVNLLDLLLHQ